MQTDRIRCVLLVATLSATLPGCIGIDHTVFYTKTNRGVEFAATPPTLALDISRDEGIVTPQFQNGLTLPVLASFKTDSDRLFAANAGSTFATGDAAMTLATLYDSPVSGTVSDASLHLTEPPVNRGGNSTVDFQQNDVRPLIFSTKTSLGLRIGWSNLTASLPDNFTLGYNRTELALLPVTMKSSSPNGNNGTVEINQASLLATLDFVLSAPAAAPGLGDAESDPELVYLQYFATGSAASELATHPEVRAAMLSRLDPEQDFVISSLGLPVILPMVDLLAELAGNDPYAESLLNVLESKTFVIPDQFPYGDLVSYNVHEEDDTIELSNSIIPFNDKDLVDFVALLNLLRQSAEATSNSLNKVNNALNNAVTTFNFIGYDRPGPRAPEAADVERLTRELKVLNAAFIDYYRLFANDEDIREAYRYISSRMASGG